MIQLRKNLVTFIFILTSLVGAAFTVHAQAIPGDATKPCSSSNVISDQCYIKNCSGTAGQVSTSCDAYAGYVAKRDDGGDTSCQSIGDTNEQSCCLDSKGDLQTDASPMCVAFESYSGGSNNANNIFNTNTSSSSSNSSSSGGGSVQNAPLNIHLINPLTGVSTIPDVINKILSIVIRVALPLIILFFIWSGLTFIFAQGNPTKIQTAKRMFFYTVIGMLLILGAWVITNAIIGTVNAITG
ncbi:MAG TPA: pilin [Candidatus Paceibacterota bacterium]|jgi:hypothetical protein|nr:pilin [Candidatus Paceibacterota bacterium]